MTGGHGDGEAIGWGLLRRPGADGASATAPRARRRRGSGTPRDPRRVVSRALPLRLPSRRSPADRHARPGRAPGPGAPPPRRLARRPAGSRTRLWPPTSPSCTIRAGHLAGGGRGGVPGPPRRRGEAGRSPGRFSTDRRALEQSRIHVVAAATPLGELGGCDRPRAPRPEPRGPGRPRRPRATATALATTDYIAAADVATVADLVVLRSQTGDAGRRGDRRRRPGGRLVVARSLHWREQPAAHLRPTIAPPFYNRSL